MDKNTELGCVEFIRTRYTIKQPNNKPHWHTHKQTNKQTNKQNNDLPSKAFQPFLPPNNNNNNNNNKQFNKRLFTLDTFPFQRILKCLFHNPVHYYQQFRKMNKEISSLSQNDYNKWFKFPTQAGLFISLLFLQVLPVRNGDCLEIKVCKKCAW